MKGRFHSRFLDTLQMIIDTIFLCFCEDCEKNDGISRPYFMSRGLMVRIKQIGLPIWTPAVHYIRYVCRGRK